MGATGRTERGNSARRLLIIAGPTASGKSALALALAQRLGGTIINADAMQCYRELRVITARPSAADEAAVPHRLYGVRPAAAPPNAAWWRGAALAALEECQLPILCGGTGMYFSALINGIADIPDPGAQARATARQLLAERGPAALHAMLDPETAARLKPTDSQRVARAYEVWLGTGRGLAAWQSQPTQGLTGWKSRMLLLDPPRPALAEAIAGRFAAMLAAGAADEVAALLALGLDPALPLMRAHGVPELAAYLRGQSTLEAAESAAISATQRYTKRQMTWFRHQKLVAPEHMKTITTKIHHFEQYLESDARDLINFVNS